jgi:nucleoside-diphosphate-sugar epimerase
MARDSKHLVIFGCGYVGSAVAAEACQRGWRVTALTRNQATAATLTQRGIVAVVADLATTEWYGKINAPADRVLNCVGSGGGAVDGYRRSYVEGMRSIATWLKGQKSQRPDFIYTSSTSVYPKDVCGTVDESTPTYPDTPHIAQLLEAERLVAAEIAPHCARWFSLRLAGIYGPGRHRLLDVARTGEWTFGADFTRPINVVHLADIVSATFACFESPEAESGIYNVADGSPASRQEILAWLSERLGKPSPPLACVEEPATVRSVEPRRLRLELGWRPTYPDFRAGYEAILKGA